VSGFVAATSFSSGASAVSTFTVTVPAGVVSTDTVFLWVVVAANAARTVTCPGFSALLNDQAMATFSRATLLSGAGHTAGDTLTVTIAGGAGITGAVCAGYDGYSFDAVGVGAASANPIAVHGATSTTANDIAIAFAVVVSGGTAAITGVNSGTIRANVSAGGSTRNYDLSVSDQIQATAGLGVTVSVALSGSPAGTTGVSVAMSPAAVASGGYKVNVAGTATAATRKVNVGGVATAATRTVRTS
jgi:hypothetical protein